MFPAKHPAPEIDNRRFLLAKFPHRLVVFDDVDDGRLDMARIVWVPPMRLPLGPFILAVSFARRHQNGDLQQWVRQSGLILDVAMGFAQGLSEFGIVET